MTAQISDFFRLEDDEFELTAFQGQGIFSPSALGLSPVEATTACWRGFVCQFGIIQNSLVVEELWATNGELIEGIFHPQPGPFIDGVTPDSGEKSGIFFNCRYCGLSLPVEFTGGMLLGNEYLFDRYEWVAFKRPWQFQKVIELVFETGKLTQMTDLSQIMCLVRDQVEETLLSPFIEEREQARSWIQKTYNLDYHF